MIPDATQTCRFCKRLIAERPDGTWGDVSDPQPFQCRSALDHVHAPVTGDAPLTGDCGECDQVEQFEWDSILVLDDGPVIVCKAHREPGPGWVYERDDIERGP